MTTVTIEKFFAERPQGIIFKIFSAFILIIALLLAFKVLRPLPPESVIMVTGSEGGAYREVAEQYRDILAQSGIELQLQPTAGSLENLEKLNDRNSGISVGLLQGGITDEKSSAALETLGAVFYEPLWFFSRISLPGSSLDGLQGKKISIGPKGSGTRAMSLELLARNGIDRNFAELLPLSPRHSADGLLNGTVDAATIFTSWRSPVIKQLLSSDKLELVSFPRTDAYVALYPYLNKLVVPAGVGDLAKGLPPKDAHLLGTKASLVVRKDLHPAIKYLLLDAAEQVNSGPGIFQKPGEFPAAESIDLPLGSEARQFYKSGRPFFQRYLPFWLAVQLDRLLIILIPLIGLMYPLFRILPVVYDWNMKRKIYRLYGELWFLEHELEASSDSINTADLTRKLNSLEEKAGRLRLPSSYVDMLYRLRQHIALVREQLKGGNPKTPISNPRPVVDSKYPA